MRKTGIGLERVSNIGIDDDVTVTVLMPVTVI